MLAVVPAMVVTMAVGIQGINQLLFGSQVVLSLILPFVVFPLVLLTSSKSVMTVVNDENEDVQEGGNVDEERVHSTEVYFGNGRVMTCVGWFIFLIILIANICTLVVLIKGAM